jgi:predicted nucleic acid-binding protein
LIPLLTVRRNIQTRQQALQQVKVLKRYSTLRIIHIDERLDNLAWALLEHYSDKLWSLVDAASFVIMREMGMLEAITTDHHFEQAGFVRLLSA